MYFAGIDAHLKYVTVAVVDSFGSLAHKTRVSTEEPQRLLELIDQVTPMIRALDRRIRTGATAHPTAQLLATIPGIGPYRSLLLAAELEPIERFPRPAHLVSYAGLAPSTRSSGGHTRHGNIPKGANRWVRGALVSAIPSHVRHAPESPVSRAYDQLKARLGWRVARIAAARKLARILHAMVRRGESWRG